MLFEIRLNLVEGFDFTVEHWRLRMDERWWRLLFGPGICWGILIE
jgi:hypothetical protein